MRAQLAYWATSTPAGQRSSPELGAEHCRTDQPIVYTSADSVLQIAAHEETFGLQRLYEVCEVARRLCDPLNIGRVIARPFVGSDVRELCRAQETGRDYAEQPPPRNNLLDRVVQGGGGSVWSVGKVEDIFAHRSITRTQQGQWARGAVGRHARRSAERAGDDGDLNLRQLCRFRQQVSATVASQAATPSALEYWDQPTCLSCCHCCATAIWCSGRPTTATIQHGREPTTRGNRCPMLFFGPAAPKGVNARSV